MSQTDPEILIMAEAISVMAMAVLAIWVALMSISK
jgi:hypothetical protein